MYSIPGSYSCVGCSAVFGIYLPMFLANIILTSSVWQYIVQNVDVFLLDYTWPHITQGIMLHSHFLENFLSFKYRLLNQNFVSIQTVMRLHKEYICYVTAFLK
jgi:hypothetical protein